MNPLKYSCLVVFELAKQLFFLPRTIFYTVQHRRQRNVLDEQEAERVDRICNPSKYLGKE